MGTHFFNCSNYKQVPETPVFAVHRHVASLPRTSSPEPFIANYQHLCSSYGYTVLLLTSFCNAVLNQSGKVEPLELPALLEGCNSKAQYPVDGFLVLSFLWLPSLVQLETQTGISESTDNFGIGTVRKMEKMHKYLNLWEAYFSLWDLPKKYKKESKDWIYRTRWSITLM